MGEVEEQMWFQMRKYYKCLAGMDYMDSDFSAALKREDIFPLLIHEEKLKKFPKTVVLTSEYDFFRRSSERMAQRMLDAGVLLDFACYPSTSHGYYLIQQHPLAELHYIDMKKMFATYFV